MRPGGGYAHGLTIQVNFLMFPDNVNEKNGLRDSTSKSN